MLYRRDQGGVEAGLDEVGGQEVDTREDGHGEGDVEGHMEGELLADAGKWVERRRFTRRKVLKKLSHLVVLQRPWSGAGARAPPWVQKAPW